MMEDSHYQFLRENATPASLSLAVTQIQAALRQDRSSGGHRRRLALMSALVQELPPLVDAIEARRGAPDNEELRTEVRAALIRGDILRARLGRPRTRLEEWLEALVNEIANLARHAYPEMVADSISADRPRSLHAQAKLLKATVRFLIGDARG